MNCSNKSAHHALRDIKKYLEENESTLTTGGINHDNYAVWVVLGRKYLYNKEQRELNRLLGVHKINKMDSYKNLL